MYSTLQAADCLKECQKEFYNSFYIISDKRIFLFSFHPGTQSHPLTSKMVSKIENRGRGKESFQGYCFHNFFFHPILLTKFVLLQVDCKILYKHEYSFPNLATKGLKMINTYEQNHHERQTIGSGKMNLKLSF